MGYKSAAQRKAVHASKAEQKQNKKPMNFNAKRVQAVKAGKDSFEVGGKSFPVTSKAMKYKPMKHKGPYMMKPGSKEINTPGTFRADSKAMMFKLNKFKSKKPIKNIGRGVQTDIHSIPGGSPLPRPIGGYTAEEQKARINIQANKRSGRNKPNTKGKNIGNYSGGRMYNK